MVICKSPLATATFNNLHEFGWKRQNISHWVLIGANLQYHRAQVNRNEVGPPAREWWRLLSAFWTERLSIPAQGLNEKGPLTPWALIHWLGTQVERGVQGRYPFDKLISVFLIRASNHFDKLLWKRMSKKCCKIFKKNNKSCKKKKKQKIRIFCQNPCKFYNLKSIQEIYTLE